MTVLAALVLANVAPVASVRSPDGRNELRMFAAPLAYEVLRDGRMLVGRSPIGLGVDGAVLGKGDAMPRIREERLSGSFGTPVYKKSSVDLSGNAAFLGFDRWGVRLVARNDGVAYRFETSFPGNVRIDREQAPVVVPERSARCWANRTGAFGQEESIPSAFSAEDLKTDPDGGLENWMGSRMVYLPFSYAVGGKYVAVTESDVRDYPIWNLVSTTGTVAGVRFDSLFAGEPKATFRAETGANWTELKELPSGGRWIKVRESAPWLVTTTGTRTYPWRIFVLADDPKKFCEADIVQALAAPKSAADDFSWVRPGKVAWDWWNAFDNQGDAGCNTKTYERFIDFASKNGVEYVIFDEGWSESLNIWKFHPNVDVPHLIRYAEARNVGIILWMAWAQVVGEEERVAEHFAELGARGFKVDFMDRGGAAVSVFLEKFAAACARNRMLVDYHGVYRPTGLQRKYPNIVNYEGVHGLEQMKWFSRKPSEMMSNDVRAFFLRMTAGPLDYTPGAMINHPLASGYRGDARFPGSLGTRCRQMAMLALYEAPLQMLCDSPSNYERNGECFAAMAAVPTVWDETVGLGGDPDTLAAVARRRGEVWYAAAITDGDARDFVLKTDFLGRGDWTVDVFRDAEDSDRSPTHYRHEKTAVRAGDSRRIHLSGGGGFLVRFTRQ